MENLRDLFQVLTRRFGMLNKNCCTVGRMEISLVQSHIIHEIDKHSKPSVHQIADTLGMDITTFSRQVKTLTKMGLVKKQQLQEDRRVYLLSLTTEGKYVSTVIDAEMNQYLAEVFTHMNEFERDTVIRSVKLLNEAMSKSSVCCKPYL